MTSGTYIIAEAGVNHNGSLERAMQMVEAASAAGADAVKFQTFHSSELVTGFAEKADYQKQNEGAVGSQYEMLRQLELSAVEFGALKNHCGHLGIEFLSTPFDIPSVGLLVDLGVERWKLPSGEMTNLPYLRRIGSLGHEVIASTGMCCLDEIEEALSVLESAGTGRENITLLQCNTEYPTSMEDVNLRAMQALSDSFPGLKGVGYSDHTLGIEVPVAAVALGATVIEKHFTLDRSLPGPDHNASLEPKDLASMVVAVRNIEKALGHGEKKPSPSELRNRPFARKSIVAGKPIARGDVFTEENLAVKRPGTGISPMRWDEVLGRVATRNYDVDEMIDA